MSGIIVYRSNYGSTKQYAEWIAEATSFSMFDSRDASIPWDAETVVIGCPVIANKPLLLGWMKKHWDKLSGKRVFLFTTSGADPATMPVKDWIEKALPENMKGTVKVVPLAGRFKLSELGFAHKLIMRIGALIIPGDDVKNQIRNPIDGVDRANLSALLDRLST